MGGAGHPTGHALGAGDVDLAAEPEDREHGVAERGHDVGTVAGPDAGHVLTLGHIADVMDPVLDSAMWLYGSEGGKVTLILGWGARVGCRRR